MNSLLGYDAGALKQGRLLPIEWNWDKVINPHIMIAGGSGSGKTHTIRQMMSLMSSSVHPGQKVRFHVFDTHGDMEIPGACSIKFSEQTRAGLNPLRINPDPDFGGVRKRVQGFIRTLNRVSTLALGIKQEACLRNILLDVYAMHGFHQDKPETWVIDESKSHLVSDGSDGRLYLDIPPSDFEKARALGVAKWDPAKGLFWVPIQHYANGVTQWPAKRGGRSHPTIADVLAYAKRLLVISYLGSDQEAVTCLEAFNRAANAYQRRVLEAARQGDTGWRDEAAEEGLERSATKAIDCYAAYVGSIRTGRELDNLLKYDSTDVLKAVCNRLEGMTHAGVFKDKSITFDPDATVLRYNLGAFEEQEKRMFVMFRLEELFAQARQRGVQDEVIDVYVLDEFGVYATAAADPDGIINVIAREGRKFSCSLLCAHQTPVDFPDSFMSSVATKILLGVDEQYWKTLVSKMRIDERLLKWVLPWQTMAVQLKEKGASNNDWRWVVLPQAAKVTLARQAAAR